MNDDCKNTWMLAAMRDSSNLSMLRTKEFKIIKIGSMTDLESIPYLSLMMENGRREIRFNATLKMRMTLYLSIRKIAHFTKKSPYISVRAF